MGTLRDLQGFLHTQVATLGDALEGLERLQGKYETFFQEVQRVRDLELEQIQRGVAEVAAAGEAAGGRVAEQAQRLVLFRARLAVLAEEAAGRFNEELARKRAELVALDAQAEGVRQEALALDEELRAENVALDREEEALKARVAELQTAIEAFNDRIRAMGRGFGFFWNLPRMGALRREREALVEEQGDVVARLEVLRARWSEAAAEGREREAEHRARWLEVRRTRDALARKLAVLEARRPELVARTALLAALREIPVPSGEPGVDDARCPRCGVRNLPQQRFCRICAVRLGDDRPDAAGSLVEAAELLGHCDRFERGVGACQELIGLLRGLVSGHERFLESVENMISSEARYASLSTLELDVPAEAVELAQGFVRVKVALRAAASRKRVEPLAFAAEVRTLVDEVIDAERVQQYFEGMGEALSSAADEQWPS